MSPRTFLLCLQALFVQAVYSQCWAGPEFGLGPIDAYEGVINPYAYDGLRGQCGNGIYPSILSNIDFTPTTSGGFSVTSGSAVPPSGISLKSDNAYEGILAVAGELPFVGTTGVDGLVPSVGGGAIKHTCGNGLNALTALSLVSSPASVVSELTGPCGVPAFAPGLAGPTFIAPESAVPAFSLPNLAAPYGGVPIVHQTLPCDEGFLDAPYDIEFTPTDGGNLPVSSASAVPPTGLAVTSETTYGGSLALAGELPFVGTVGVDGVMPTTGVGAVNHACGDGINAMVSDNSVIASGLPAASGPGYSGAMFAPGVFGPSAAVKPGYDYRTWAGRGCGCGL